ncbi:GH92 family glycosyl hydrolase [Lactobacillus hominis]|uniref:Sugar hydrolase n=1 Tax=Lactobacillus hominis DSM 23910 = CRBIP 24.179 TaxID=1423758 RepID=I7L7C7_9LACO|nr:GH92 family glycosyl hydrolase [Lactobacillus hominis]KRM85189.1 sugar hydrolase [Lactobacillus hominis DSM 23910 = CRBIP 24.179]MCT3348350.1 alpha-mannosidase [Lactobacillus hominis]CCI82552.1 Sugar hydrolase [Lactobacillus hominis DSM 23910 = CRBIP 24.179]
MDVASIDTRVGTESKYEFSHGNTLPLTGQSFSMNYLSVQTSTHEDSWWFNPQDHTFAGLRLTHQPSPWIGDFQHFLFRFKTDVNFDLKQIDDYNPNKAIFRPDLIALDSLNQQIKVMATASKIGGVLRAFNYSQDQLKLIIQGEKLSFVRFKDDTLIFKTNNFSACADPNFTMWVAVSCKHMKFEAEQTVDKQNALILSIPNKNQIRFATSFISEFQVKTNLSRIGNFDTVQQATIKDWNNLLSKINIQDSQKEKVLTFYENFYRSFLFPMQFYELDENNSPVHYSTALKKAIKGKMFTNVGFWDVYRSSFPLYSLLCPDKYSEFLEGFFNSYQETGFLPRWLSPDERGMMPGTMLDVIIADAAVKGIKVANLEKYYDAMVKGAETSSKDAKYGREGLEEYKKLGYVSSNYPESVNKTLDYAYSDWAISILAKILGKDEQAKYYSKRALNYQNLFNKKVGLMTPKDAHGNFVKNFKDTDWGNGFTEGSAWQNSFNVYQDLPGLIKLYGNNKNFIQTLLKLVNQPPKYGIGSYGQTIHEMREMVAQPFGQLAISNQPSFHLCYLFALAGKPHYTELLVRQLLSSFNSSFKGYPGDEDNGSMGAWYVWSALGLYPQAPGSGKYVFGIPLFDFASIKLPNGKKLEMLNENNDQTHQFVAGRNFNDQKCSQEISHQELLEGGLLTTKLTLLA